MALLEEEEALAWFLPLAFKEVFNKEPMGS